MNETKTNRTTIFKTDEVISYNKDKEKKQHIALRKKRVRVRIITFLKMFKKRTRSQKNIFLCSLVRDNIYLYFLILISVTCSPNPIIHTLKTEIAIMLSW